MRLIKWFLAYWHLSDDAVCSLSIDSRDYHDYVDSETPEPDHFRIHRCKRCGKEFTI